MFRIHWLFALAAASTFALAHLAASAPDERSRGDAGTTLTVGYEIVNAWPHDATAFTQGLAFEDGVLYESTGRYGFSTLRIVDLTTGKIRKQVQLPDRYFAEGIALWKGKIFQLTWRERKGFIYDRTDLRLLGEFSYEGEGWGLTTDGRSFIMSDGTDHLRFFDPETFKIRKTLAVRENGKPVANLNELEFIKGEIYANVWQKDAILIIDPKTGSVRRHIDLSALVPPELRQRWDAVLNGIAYDRAADRLFVTGKLWPRLYEIRLKEQR